MAPVQMVNVCPECGGTRKLVQPISPMGMFDVSETDCWRCLSDDLEAALDAVDDELTAQTVNE